MIGADSHTPNAGGLGMLRHRRRRRGLRRGHGRAAVGGARIPKLIGVHLTGKLSRLDGAQGRHHLPLRAPDRQGRHQHDRRVLRPGRGSRSAPPARARSATWARSSARPPRCSPSTTRMAAYLRATDRADIARAGRAAPRAPGAPIPRSRPTPRSSTTRWSRSTSPTLEPHIVGPHSPDRARPISKLAAEVQTERLAGRDQAARSSAAAPTPPTRTCSARPTSPCRRSRPGSRRRRPFLVTPGSEHIYQTIKRDGHDGDASSRSAAPCSPTPAARASGSGSAPTSGQDEPNTIVSSFNRNFPGRNDGSAATLSFIDQPRDRDRAGVRGHARVRPGAPTPCTGAGRQGVPLHAARGARSCRAQGFARGRGGLRGARRRRRAASQVDDRCRTASGCSCSSRSRAWDGKDFVDLPILVKTKGKTTTDHISPAGAVAALPRPPRQDQRQHVPGRDQRLHRRGGQGRQRR